jgi:hypothetical protein
METENGLYNTESTINSGCYSKQITRKLKTAYSPPCSIYASAESLIHAALSGSFWKNSEYKKCFVSETRTLLRTS